MRLARIQAFKLGVDEQTFIGQHVIDHKNVAAIEYRLEKEAPPVLTDAELEHKLVREKMHRLRQIEVLFTLRESEYLGIQEAILRNNNSIALPNTAATRRGSQLMLSKQQSPSSQRRKSLF